MTRKEMPMDCVSRLLLAARIITWPCQASTVTMGTVHSGLILGRRGQQPSTAHSTMHTPHMHPVKLAIIPTIASVNTGVGIYIYTCVCCWLNMFMFLVTVAHLLSFLPILGTQWGACACDVNSETRLVCMTRRQTLGQSGVGKSRTCRFPYGQPSTLRLGLCESRS